MIELVVDSGTGITDPPNRNELLGGMAGCRLVPLTNFTWLRVRCNYTELELGRTLC